MEKRLDIDNIAENAPTRQDKTRQDKTRQDKTRQDKTRQDYHSWSNRQYGQTEQGQHESVIRQRSDLHLEVTHRQRSSVSYEKVLKPFKALNDYNGKCRTIKSQYYKNSIDNFLSQGSFGATGVIRKLEEVSNDWTDG